MDNTWEMKQVLKDQQNRAEADNARKIEEFRANFKPNDTGNYKGNRRRQKEDKAKQDKEFYSRVSATPPVAKAQPRGRTRISSLAATYGSMALFAGMATVKPQDKK